MSWFKQGEEGAASAKAEDERRQAEFAGMVSRFWLKPDKSTKIIFLDSKGFYYREHQIKKNGSWLNWETCISDIGEDDCPVCENGYKYAYVCAFSIIDCSKYTDKRGNKVTARKKLMICKSTARNKILKRKEKLDGDLTGCIFEVTRYNEKESSTGEDFEFLQRVTVEEIKELCPQGDDAAEFIKPYDYIDLFQPKTVDELREFVGVKAPIGAEDAPSTQQKSSNTKKSGEAKSLKDLI
jgi:hypothetical protein